MRLSIASIGFAVLSSLAVPAHATPHWQLVLRRQMWSERKCSANYYSDVQERETADRIELSARVHCSDGRIFDAQWDLRAHRFSVSPSAASPSAHEEQNLSDR